MRSLLYLTGRTPSPFPAEPEHPENDQGRHPDLRFKRVVLHYIAFSKSTHWNWSGLANGNHARDDSATSGFPRNALSIQLRSTRDRSYTLRSWDARGSKSPLSARRRWGSWTTSNYFESGDLGRHWQAVIIHMALGFITPEPPKC